MPGIGASSPPLGTSDRHPLAKPAEIREKQLALRPVFAHTGKDHGDVRLPPSVAASRPADAHGSGAWG